MMRLMFFTACVLFFFCLAPGLGAQDTEFWFVAPHLDDNKKGATSTGNHSRPVYFVVTAGDAPAVVTMEMPAFADFSSRTLTLAAHESQRIEFGSGFASGSVNDFADRQMDTIQNRIRMSYDDHSLPPGKYNRGICFRSTAPVTVYYQVDAHNSKDLFALKGSKALGKEFYTPFQTEHLASYPCAYPQFHIVATEDDTEIRITPAAPVNTNAGPVDAGATATVYLDRGETFAARSYAHAQAARLAGSHIVADKPVAVTVCDDLLTSGNPADVTGDQLVPVEGLGSAYVVIRGFADSGTSYCDRVFILATRDNTLVSINGGPEQPLSAGQQISHSMPGALTATVVSDSAVYVYQLSGFGNADGATERGAALLPSMYSIGSRRIIFDKSAGSYNNRVMVLVRAGSEGDFTVNGSSSVLKATDFTAVSGMSDWMYARKDISSVANGFIDVVNGTGAFSLGYFYSGSTDNRTSASFGYFSAYGDFKFPGDGITWMCGSGTVLAGSYAKSYKWFFNGEEIAGETGSSLTVTQEGVYKIEMDQDGATVKDSTEVRKVRAGTVCANQYICTGTSPAELSVSGSSGDIYQWQSCLDGPDGSWADIEGATSAAYTPEPLTQTTYYRRGTAASQCAPVYSGGMEVKVSPCVVPVNPHLRTRAVR